MKALSASSALALALGLGVASTGLPVAAQQSEPMAGSAVCDQDGNGYVSVDEARTCDEQRFGEMAGDEDYVTQEQFGEAFPDSAETFAEADEDGDGQISQDEWMSWRERGFAEAVGDSEQGMPANEYSDWNPTFPSSPQEGDSGADEGSAPGSAPN